MTNQNQVNQNPTDPNKAQDKSQDKSQGQYSGQSKPQNQQYKGGIKNEPAQKDKRMEEQDESSSCATGNKSNQGGCN